MSYNSDSSLWSSRPFLLGNELEPDGEAQCWLQKPRLLDRSVLAATCGLLLLSISLEFLSLSSAQSTLTPNGSRLLPKSKAFSFDQSSYGVNATLTYRSVTCSTNSSAQSKISPRVHQLRCSVTRSASRAEYLSGPEVLSNAPEDFGLAVEISDLSHDQVANSSLESDVWYQSQYVMSLEIGTPARVFTGIIDTGSDLTWIQCRPCLACYQEIHTIFRPWESSTYNRVACESKMCDQIPSSFCTSPQGHCVYSYRYGDRSMTLGTLSTDTFTLNSTDGSEVRLPGMVYGCAHASEGTFTLAEADGIVGLGRGNLSLASQVGLVLGTSKFSYCLTSQNLLSHAVSSPLYFGPAAAPSNATGLSYTRMISNKSRPVLYYVEFLGLSVGGKRLQIAQEVFAIQSETGRGGTIIDSGTTVTNLEKRAFDALVRAFRSAVSLPTAVSDSGFDLCFESRGRDLAKFPTLTFHLREVDLHLPLENYIVEAETDTLCLAIHRSSRSGFSIIGNIQQQNYHIIYDLENEQIGFKLTVCG
ncbi:hypothetical protein Mapa_016621 [Marchantia paleacea]|nr:hypothetical protein Mapa_016621 [Marchantia paleacea]